MGVSHAAWVPPTPSFSSWRGSRDLHPPETWWLCSRAMYKSFAVQNGGGESGLDDKLGSNPENSSTSSSAMSTLRKCKYARRVHVHRRLAPSTDLLLTKTVVSRSC